MPFVYLFFIACMIAFILLFRMQEAPDARLLGSAFFVYASVFNLFVVSVFWSFMVDLVRRRTGAPAVPHRSVSAPRSVRSRVPVDQGVRLPHRCRWPARDLRLAARRAVFLPARAFALVLLPPGHGDDRREQQHHRRSFLLGAAETLKSPLMRRLAILMLLGDAVGTGPSWPPCSSTTTAA